MQYGKHTKLINIAKMNRQNLCQSCFLNKKNHNKT